MEGIDGIVQVLEIGIRTTKLRLAKWDSIKKIPNSKMITGIVENWSQNPGSEQSFVLI
ncbi:mechanosensitive ion channel domain-containing protein [Microcoleus sp. OTE_8_concoct_300]|uniref:mechanosensitive ion channel domain-containing protein n=1 Tax=Microcoleus sp. OTE_8_concoct_300 TaxID=2964710 RepID=UPI00403F2A7A